MEWLTALGVLATIIGGVGGTYAVIMARRTESRSATREETQQALEAQSGLLDRYEKRIEKLEGRAASLEQTAEDAIAREMECRRELGTVREELESVHGRLAELERKSNG